MGGLRKWRARIWVLAGHASIVHWLVVAAKTVSGNWIIAAGVALGVTLWAWLEGLHPFQAVMVGASLIVLAVVVIAIVQMVMTWKRERSQRFRFTISARAGKLHAEVQNNGVTDEVSFQVVRVRGVYAGGFAFPLQMVWDDSNEARTKIAKNDSRVAYIGHASFRWEEAETGGQMVQRPVATFAFRTPTGERVVSQYPCFSKNDGVGHLWELELRAVSSDGAATTCRAHLYMGEWQSGTKAWQGGKSIPGFDMYPGYAGGWPTSAQREPW